MTAELEPVAWAYSFKERSPVLTDEKKDWAVGNSKWAEKPLVTLSSAQEAIDKREERIRALDGLIAEYRDHAVPYWEARAEAAEARVKELEDENEALSAHACIFLDGSGVTGDDHGNSICLMSRRASALQALLDEVGEVIEENWLGEYWRSVDGTMASRVSAIAAKIKEAKGP